MVVGGLDYWTRMAMSVVTAVLFLCAIIYLCFWWDKNNPL